MRHPRLPVVAALLAGCLTLAGVTVAAVHVHAGGGRHQASAASLRAAPVRADRSRRTRPLVPALHRLVSPDVLIELASAAKPQAMRRLARTDGVRAVAALDRGSVRLGGVRLRTIGIDIRSVRGLTPKFTATSERLWASVARHEITVGYSMTGRLGRSLGISFPVTGTTDAPAALRIGAFASIGLGNAQAMVDRSLSRTLGLRSARLVVFAAPKLSRQRLAEVARSAFGGRARVHVLRPAPIRQYVVNAYARAMIPPAYLQLYRAAAVTCRGLPWTVLAAIGTVESHNGANPRTSSKGAMGPMQFLPSTFAAYAVDASGDGVADIMNPADAIFSAARLLCAWGAGLGGQSLLDAIWGYNHADWYVREVVALALAYT
jgi:hypothetical protein